MATESVDSKSVVASTKLPYTVTVDAIVRFFQALLLAASVFNVYGLLTAYPNTTVGEWTAVGALCALSFYVRSIQALIAAAVVYAVYALPVIPTASPVVEWIVAAALCAYGVYLQYHSSGLSFDDEGIHHISLLHRRRFIPWAGIETVSTGTSYHYPTGAKNPATLKNVSRSQGAYVMVFTRKDGRPPFILDFKPYSVIGLTTLTHFVLVKAVHATIDGRTKRILDGFFPSTFFNEQKGHG